jgi:hypothetical protein
MDREGYTVRVYHGIERECRHTSDRSQATDKPATAFDMPRESVMNYAVLAVRASLAMSLLASGSAAQQKAIPKQQQEDLRWAPIRRVFDQNGEEGDGYFRINLPRTDLRVRIGNDVLSPQFEFNSYMGFVAAAGNEVMAMGEIVMREDEVPAVMAEAHRQGVRITALHNHLIGETPRIMYAHAVMQGPAEAIATKLRAVFAKSATPLSRPRPLLPSGDWASIDAILGKHAEAEGRVAEYVFPRRERLTVHGMSVKSTGLLETASEVVFEQLGGNRVAVTGEMFVLPTEVDPVVRSLDGHGLNVTAVHGHTVDETPRMYWVHWYATGDGPTLARGVAAALAQMNSAQKSESEGANR